MKNTWNIKRLVNELFVPATHCIILKIVGFNHQMLKGYFILDSHTSLLKKP